MARPPTDGGALSLTAANMPIANFEIACVVIIGLSLWAMSRSRPPLGLLADYLALAAAAWMGEDACVRLYRHYSYSPEWHGRLDEVPVLVPLIWPLVILSARGVVSSLWPDLASSRGRLIEAGAVGAVVAFDASLVEVVAVRAGLWSWAEPGHLGVPLIGILGWGYFAIGVDIALSWKQPRRAIGVLLLGSLFVHCLLLATWWGLFRWTLRGDFGHRSLIVIFVLSLAALCLVIASRRRGGGIPLSVALPRMIAASLFLALLVSTAAGDGPLWAHTIAVAIPYLAATRFSR